MPTARASRYPPDGGPRSSGSPPPASARRRRSGAGYTRFVGMMRLVLPIVAAVLIVLVAVWPQLAEKPEGFRLGLSRITVNDRAGQRVINARYTGADAADRPYTVTAETAIQKPGIGDIVELEFPKADITVADGSWLVLAADSGTYRKAKQVLALSGGVNLFHDAGYEFRTQRARIDLGKGSASGEAPVFGQGPFGSIEAAGFRILDGGKRVLFTGKARLILYPGAKPAPP